MVRIKRAIERQLSKVVPLGRNDLESDSPGHPPAGAPNRRDVLARGTIDLMEPWKPDETGDDRETAYDLLQRGHALLERRHFAQAAIVLERADRLEPRKGSILEALGRAYFNSGQPERARETFEALLELDPSSHYAHYAIAQSLKRLGRVDRARTHLRLAVALSPDDPLYSGALERLPPARKPKESAASDDIRS